MTTSSPHKPTSRVAAAGPSGSKQLSQGLRLQNELKQNMRGEIGNQTWVFPARELAQIISPKTPKCSVGAAGNLLQLDQYSFAVDDPAFETVHRQVSKDLEAGNFFTSKVRNETAHYKNLARFLTSSMERCHAALDKQSASPLHQNRWYKDLQFTPGKPVVDRIEGSAPLKPDVVGGPGISGLKEGLYWNPPKKQPARRLMVPVEVKGQWEDMVAQAATYARGLFSTDQSRSFVLVLGFHHLKNQLRFLIFHRGGLAASEVCEVATPSGIKDAVWIFLALALGTTPGDVGFCPCFTNTEYKLPLDRSGTEFLPVASVGMLSRSICVRGRATTVSLVSPLPGTPLGGPQSQGIEPSSSQLPSSAIPPPQPQPPVTPLSHDPHQDQKPGMAIAATLRRSVRSTKNMVAGAFTKTSAKKQPEPAATSQQHTEGGFSRSHYSNFLLTISCNTTKPNISSQWKSFIQMTVRSSQKCPVRLS